MKREMETLKQMMMDNMSSKGETIDGQLVKTFFSTYAQETLEAGAVILSAVLTTRGGSIGLRTVTEVQREWEGYGKHASVICLENDFLVEPPHYASAAVEPYNRQLPYYVGMRFDDLDEKVVNEWTIRSTKEERRVKKTKVTFCVEGIFMERDEYQKLSLSFVLKPEDVQMALETLCSICRLPEDVACEISLKLQ